MKDFDEKETHDSYGLVQFSRVQGDPGPLFGAAARTGSYIELRISKGFVRRGLYREWYSSEQSLITVALSNSQFTELLTTMNMGAGVPCTIGWLNGQSVKRPEIGKPNLAKVVDEFKASMATKLADMKKTYTELKAKLENTNVSKKLQTELLSLSYASIQEYESNIPFALKSFIEESEKVTQKAKAEVEGFLVTAVQNAGIAALKSGAVTIDVPALNAGSDSDLTKPE